VLTVVRPSGPALIAVGGARIAVGRTAAQAIEVEAVTG
jgi:Fe2+ transport system protein FeoA